jgi:hypothetical protein
MRYMLLIYKDESVYDALPPEKRATVFKDATEYSEALRPSGFYQVGEPLESTPTAKTVRLKNGKALTTDGPFAETKEQLAGYTIVEARNLDEALAFAAKHPLVLAGMSIEVRPIRAGGPR